MGINESLQDFYLLADNYGARFLAALIAGAIIGVERQVYEKPAGLRTCILVTVGCALFTTVSIASGGKFGGDPLRITAQIVTGIGFLGGGVILHYKNKVKGITTAATIFICAAIGVTSGSGYIYTAIALSIMVLLVLLLLKPVDRFIDTHPFTARLRGSDRDMVRKLAKRREFVDGVLREEREKRIPRDIG